MADPVAAGRERRPRRRLPWIVAIVAALAVVAVTVGLLLAPAKKSSVPVFADAPAPRSSPHLDALVVKATDTYFALKLRGGKTVRLKIRKADAAYLDVQHANSHAALGQPVRVYYCRYDGQTIAVYLEDAGLPLSKKGFDLQPCKDNGKVFTHLVKQPPITAATTATTTTKTGATAK